MENWEAPEQDEETRGRGVSITELDKAADTWSVGAIEELTELRADLAEAWKIINAMNGNEFWERAEEWLKANEKYKPEGIR